MLLLSWDLDYNPPQYITWPELLVPRYKTEYKERAKSLARIRGCCNHGFQYNSYHSTAAEDVAQCVYINKDFDDKLLNSDANVTTVADISWISLCPQV